MKEKKTWDEPLLIERSRQGKVAYSLPTLDVEETPTPKTWQQGPDTGLPELSEPEIVRHFVRLSSWNYCIDNAFYPLGSCSMKYNPKINERAASLPGFLFLHPLAPEVLCQGALQIMADLQSYLCEISGLTAVSLQPAAGAQGEYTGIRIIREHLLRKGEKRKKILIPDTAHGTNPASSALCGYEVITVKHQNGIIPASAVEEIMTEEVAAILITNPNTLGFFETDLPEIAQIVHRKGGFVYCDGANLNAILGKVKLAELGVDVMHFNLHKTFSTPHGGGGPGSGPVGVTSELEPYLPIPTIAKKEDGYSLDFNRSLSIGKVKSFYGNFGMLVRAFTYIRTLGPEGLKKVSEVAVLHANYLRHHLKDTLFLPFTREHCMHEVIFNDRKQRKFGISTMDIVKRLLDFGFHPPTVYFPLVVGGAIMIEPTETESKETLDEFIEAIKTIAAEIEEGKADTIKEAPRLRKVRRVDEVTAARNPLLTWQELLQNAQ